MVTALSSSRVVGGQTDPDGYQKLEMPVGNRRGRQPDRRLGHHALRVLLLGPDRDGVNGQTITCGGNMTLPAKVNGGYCFQLSAGGTTSAYFGTW